MRGEGEGRFQTAEVQLSGSTGEVLLGNHHASASGLWLKIPKKNSGITGPTYAQALDESLREKLSQ